MAREIRWSPRAADNFEAICGYIANYSERYAVLFAKQVTALIRGIPAFPQSGRVVPEYCDPNLREKIYENYRLVYRIKKDRIEIAAICHGSRPLENLE